MPGPKENIERDRAYAYTLVCFLFLIVLRVALTSRGVGNWAWLPVVVGVASLALRWPTGPLAFLLAVVLLLFSHELGLDPYRLLYRVVLVTVGWVYGIEYRLPPMRSAPPACHPCWPIWGWPWAFSAFVSAITGCRDCWCACSRSTEFGGKPRFQVRKSQGQKPSLCFFGRLLPKWSADPHAR